MFTTNMENLKENNIAIIPARGGSKRIPGKNIKSFLGKPIIAYSIEAALQTGLFKKVIVSTDSEEIAKVAREFGAEVPFMRPPEISDDHTGTAEVISHALNWLTDDGEVLDYACCIYATAPLLRVGDIVSGYQILKKEGATTTVSVTTFPYSIFRAMKINDVKRLEMFRPEHYNSRSQDLPQAYHDAGQFYWLDPEKYFHSKRLFSQDTLPIIIPRYLVQDLDTDEDWTSLEILCRVLEGRGDSCLKLV